MHHLSYNTQTVFVSFRLLCYTSYVSLSENKSIDREIPVFEGTAEERLRSACIWVSGKLSRSPTHLRRNWSSDVTRERVRQIEAHALRKLRHPSRIRFLK